MRPFYFFFNFDEKLKDHYLAYFDILGYKSYFEKDSSYDFLNIIDNAVKDVKKSIDLAKMLNGNQEIRYRVYSDNFLFYIKEADNELNALVTLSYLLSKIQFRFLEKYSLLIRGGITKGKFYANDEYVFGEGLIRAYELENNKAIYPRIIIDKEEGMFSRETLTALESSKRIQKDSDGFYYVQFLNDIEEQSDFNVIKSNIKKIANNCRYRNVLDKEKIKEKEKTIAKHLWLITRYNQFVSEKNKIIFDTKVNENVLKTEVYCK